MAMFGLRKDDSGNSEENMRELLGPGHVDQAIRQAMHFCWMMLPKEKRTVDELEKQIRRIVDRAIQDLRNDADAFGSGK